MSINERLLHVFRREIIKQCEYAITAYEDIHRSLQEENEKRLWYSSQAFLIASANISKLLWPDSQHTEFPDFRLILRQSLGLTDASPIRSRVFRNHFEHFDERLEKWIKTSKRHNLADSNIGVVIKGFEPNEYLRNFDIVSLSITFQGDTYKIQPIVDEIMEIYRRVKEANTR
jgi:hypothetical protein